MIFSRWIGRFAGCGSAVDAAAPRAFPGGAPVPRSGHRTAADADAGAVVGRSAAGRRRPGSDVGDARLGAVPPGLLLPVSVDGGVGAAHANRLRRPPRRPRPVGGHCPSGTNPSAASIRFPSPKRVSKKQTSKESVKSTYYETQ